MTAHDTALQDQVIVAEIETALDWLLDARARQRITDAWAAGKIDADEAMRLLTSLDLLEAGNA